ncbi:MAG: 6-phosphofructokinase [bacterium]
MENNKTIRTIAVMTTGGDAPGMNAAIRAVVRTAIYDGLKVVGIERGFAGLLEEELNGMDSHSVSGIINRGGTILKTVRCPEFKEKKARDMAFQVVKKHGIDAMVIIGGNGSMRAAAVIIKEWKLPVNVIPASIDNDVPGTDMTIGYDTAVNTAVEAIDKIRDTATSHERIFVIEVMGRDNGFIALEVGLTSGAEAILIPEVKYDIHKICQDLQAGHKRGKVSSIIVMAEGAGSSNMVAEEIKEHTGLEVRVSILGHMQRGGTPTADSRKLACILGVEAVRALERGDHGKLMGIRGEDIVLSDITKISRQERKVDLSVLRVAEVLST